MTARKRGGYLKRERYRGREMERERGEGEGEGKKENGEKLEKGESYILFFPSPNSPWPGVGKSSHTS